MLLPLLIEDEVQNEIIAQPCQQANRKKAGRKQARSHDMDAPYDAWCRSDALGIMPPPS